MSHYSGLKVQRLVPPTCLMLAFTITLRSSWAFPRGAWSLDPLSPVAKEPNKRPFSSKWLILLLPQVAGVEGAVRLLNNIY